MNHRSITNITGDDSAQVYQLVATVDTSSRVGEETLDEAMPFTDQKFFYVLTNFFVATFSSLGISNAFYLEAYNGSGTVLYRIPLPTNPSPNESLAAKLIIDPRKVSVRLVHKIGGLVSGELQNDVLSFTAYKVPQ